MGRAQFSGKIDDTVRAEDVAHASGDTGIPSLAVRKDVAAALAGTDGDYQPLEVDANGRVHTIDVNTGAMATDLAAIEVLITAGNVDLAALEVDLAAIETLITAGNVDLAALETLVTAGNVDLAALEVDLAAIEVLITAGNVDLAAIEVLLGTIDADTGSIKTAVEIIDNAISGTEMQIDVAGTDIMLPADIQDAVVKSARAWASDGNAGGSLTLDTGGFKSLGYHAEVCDSNGRPVGTNPGAGGTDWVTEVSDNNTDWWTIFSLLNSNTYSNIPADPITNPKENACRYVKITWTASGGVGDLLYLVMSAKM